MVSPTGAEESDFNPRSREGSDHFSYLCNKYNQYFNPRSREGSDMTVTRSPCSTRYFNPRSREGSDHPIRFEMQPAFQFQSTLP